MNISDLNPPMEFIDALRIANVAVGFVACMALLAFLAIPRWREWNTSLRLGWMSLFMLCFTGTYGSFEIAFMDTYFRVPMVTTALIWAIFAAVYRNRERHPPTQHRK